VRAALHGLILCAVATSKKTRRSANGFRLADTADPSSAGDGDCTILDVILTHSDSTVFAWMFRLVREFVAVFSEIHRQTERRRM